MAANLVKAGHEVRAFDLSDAALDAAKAKGCVPFKAATEAVQGVHAVVTMLPNGAIVDAFYHENVFGHAPTSAILIDCSTIDVGTARFDLTLEATPAGDGLIVAAEYDSDLFDAATIERLADRAEAARLVAKAITVRRALLAYDEKLKLNSPLAKKAMYEIGGNYQAIAVYEQAAEWYEKYAKADKNAEKADAALSDAGP